MRKASTTIAPRRLATRRLPFRHLRVADALEGGDPFRLADLVAGWAVAGVGGHVSREHLALWVEQDILAVFRPGTRNIRALGIRPCSEGAGSRWDKLVH